MEIRFKLNPNNKKDKLIIDFLELEYNHVEFIKSNLYKMALGGTQRHLTEVNGSGGNMGEVVGTQLTPIITDTVGSVGNLTEVGGNIEIIENEFEEFF